MRKKKNLRHLSKIAEKYLVFEFSIFYVILSYIGEDAGKGEDGHLEMAPLSPPSSLSASQWSLSALHKGETRLWLLQEVWQHCQAFTANSRQLCSLLLAAALHVLSITASSEYLLYLCSSVTWKALAIMHLLSQYKDQVSHCGSVVFWTSC